MRFLSRFINAYVGFSTLNNSLGLLDLNYRLSVPTDLLETDVGEKSEV